MSKTVKKQKFGGTWSLLKLDTVAKYLAAFNTALQNKPTVRAPFHRVFIDAFAGSGAFSFDEGHDLPLFDEKASAVQHSGSAKLALEVQPPFHQLYFIEQSKENLGKLRALTASFRSANVIDGDANQEVRRLCNEIDWASSRGVIFLDPFGTDVEWPTLEAIQGTHALDVWYLFPLSGLYRNAPHAKKALSETKRNAITRVLGTGKWEEHFYSSIEHEPQLFADLPSRATKRTVEVSEIEKFVKKRLEELFPHVEDPKQLKGPTNAPMFNLFFAVSNPDRSAITVAGRIARALLKHL